MIERASVDVDAGDAIAPGSLDGLGKQPAAMALAGKPGDEADEGKLAFTRLAEVELDHSNDRLDGGDFEQLYSGIADDGFELVVIHDQSREPQPGRADLAEQRPVVVGRRAGDVAQLEGRGRHLGRG